MIEVPSCTYAPDITAHRKMMKAIALRKKRCHYYNGTLRIEF